MHEIRSAIPRKRRLAASGSIRLSCVRSRNESGSEEHPVRRLSWPWLELPGDLPRRTRRATCWMLKTRSSSRTIRKSSRRPCTCRRSISMSGCIASTVTSSRMRIRTGICMARWQHDRDHLQGLPRHGGRLSESAQFRSGGASGRHRFLLTRNSDGTRRFSGAATSFYQRSALWPDLEWEMSLVKDTVNPDHANYNAKAARAKLVSNDTAGQPGAPVSPEGPRHKDEEMECSPAISPGPRLAAAVICRSRPTGRPNGITSRAARPELRDL